MDNQNLSDLKINGTGKFSGGKYNFVSVNGVGNIEGDVDCASFKSNGASIMNGNLKSSVLKINGTSSIKGNIDSDEIKINGTADFKGAVAAKDSKIHGELNVIGNMTSDVIDLHGGMKISGDCNAENFSANGGFSVVGLLNADNINIRLHAPCRAREIGGEKIVVQMGNEFTLKKIIKSLFPNWDLSRKLTSDVIEGDDIELQSTKAKVVRGNNVIIRDGCEIDLVEYKTSFNQDKNSTVKENRKV